ncbi:MAG: beta/gamma crystallin-related protein [Vulcanimicrobiaceae bacterium]
MISMRYAFLVAVLMLALGASSSAQMVHPQPQAAAPVAGPLITLYSQDHYNGPNLKLQKVTPDIHTERFPYPIASFIVNRGRWLLCNQRFFKGTCVTVGVGMYPAAFQGGFAQSVISLRPLN